MPNKNQTAYDNIKITTKKDLESARQQKLADKMGYPGGYKGLKDISPNPKDASVFKTKKVAGDIKPKHKGDTFVIDKKK